MNLVDYFIGRRLATDEAEKQHIGPFAGIPVLGLDALSSAAYGPEAALLLGIAYLNSKRKASAEYFKRNERNERNAKQLSR
jgi:hypothetical protein